MSSLFGNILKGWTDYSKGIEEGGHHQYEHMWGMVIDLDKCTGCNACSVACYAENNIATVGEEKYVARQSMQWLRVERYFDEPDLDPDAIDDENAMQERGASFLPMMCQQCNAATCEPVCPVAATYHTPDGLNAQIYNRCIGSRYCANNCPYRLRVFNFYSYTDENGAWPEPMKQQLNPDISVREKGVMEKCTFCIQRIRAAKDKAKMENRQVTEGEVKTACQQTCPTQAIMFGDLLNPESKVTQAWVRQQIKLGKYKQDRENPTLRGYRIFEELNTDPSVLYLERVREE